MADEKASSVAKKEELVGLLASMGFPSTHVVRALDVVNPLAPNAVELVLTWLEQHPMTDELRHEHVESLLEPLLAMGFSRAEAKEALDASGDNVDRAIESLLARSNDEEKKQRQERDAERRRVREAEQERRRRQEEEEQRQREEDLKKAKEANALSFGSQVALRSSVHGTYMLSITDKEDLNSFGREIVPEATFVLEKPNAPADRSLIHHCDRVALKCSDGCYVGVEANGSVHSNRREFGAFMVWRIRDVAIKDDGEEKATIGPDSVVSFESPLHNYLAAAEREGAGCQASSRDSASPQHHWHVQFQQYAPVDKLKRMSSIRMQFDASAMGDGTVGQKLWRYLRSTFRLRALRMQKQEIEAFGREIEKQKAQLEEQMQEEHQCVMCWDADRNTVLLECGHICVCDECAPLLEGRDCPSCRSKVERWVKIKRA